MKKQRNKILTLTILISIATFIIHIINKIISFSSSLKEMLDITNKNYYNWRFGNVYYTKRGKGKPILLIHDLLPGSSGYEWSKVERELSTEYTVYTIDLPGCGRSEKPGITYTNFMYVQFICDFIKNVIGEKANIISSGFSSSFVIMACHNEKECFGKIMMINPPRIASINQMPTQKDKLLKYFLDIPVFGTFVYHIVVSRENIKNMFIEKMYYNPFHLDEDVIDAYYEAAHKGGYYAKYLYASIASKYLNINIAHALKSIDNSIYILEGEGETNATSIINEYSELNPAIEHASIKKSKHFPHLENAEAFLEQIGIYF